MNYAIREKNFYEKRWAEVIDGKKSSGYRADSDPDKTVIEFAAFLQKNKIAGPILDLGCGNGRHAIFLGKKGFDSFGIDVSPSAIAIAKKKKGANFKVGSAFDIPFSDAFFGVVIDSGCLHHLRKSQWPKYKKELNRTLRPGGHYLLQCFNRKTAYIPNISPRSKRGWYVRKDGHYNHFFDKNEIKEFLGKEFVITKVDEYTRQRTNQHTPLLFWSILARVNF